jgi:hypothetical protein
MVAGTGKRKPLYEATVVVVVMHQVSHTLMLMLCAEHEVDKASVVA